MRGFFRVLLLATGICMLASSSGMARPPQEQADVTPQSKLPILLKRFTFGNGTVTGIVMNASKPLYAVPGAQVCWQTNCVTSSYPDGIFTIEIVPSGIQTLTASLEGFNTVDQTVYVIGNTLNTQNIAMIPIVKDSGVRYRIMTTWDAQVCWPDPNGPDCGGTGWYNDLDAHLWVWGIPPNNVTYHVGYYFHQNPANNDQWEYWLDMGDCYSFPNACLERDARQGYGPETIAIKELVPETNYIFGLMNANQGQSGVPGISQTSALVRLYDDTGLARSWPVPTNQGDKNFWYVFSLALNTETGEGVITEHNCIIYYPDNSNPPQCTP